MQKFKLKATKTMTFKEGCEKYLEYCRQRNLREGTIRHYGQSYTQFYKYFDPDMPIEQIKQVLDNFRADYLSGDLQRNLEASVGGSNLSSISTDDLVGML